MEATADRIRQAFDKAREERRAALVLFLTGGFPDIDTTERLIETVADAGADLVELGVPFSDPIADGPTIQAASYEALRAGASLDRLLKMVGRLRTRCSVPIVLFGAYNPFLRYGLEALNREAVDAGVDGFLVPDLPLEEAGEFDAVCRAHGRALVYLVAPATSPERMAAIAAQGTGFLYVVSLKGVTGVSIEVGEALREQVARLRRLSPLPVAVGFGIRTPEHARVVAALADGVIVGSELVRVIDKHRGTPELHERVGAYVRELRAAVVRA